MYIDPFVAGILCTIGVELILCVVWAIVSGKKNNKNN